MAEESSVSTRGFAIGHDSAAAGQIALAPDVTAVNADRQIMQQPVIHSGQKAAICNPVTVRVLVPVMDGHIIAATHGESAPAVVRTRGRRWRHNVLANDILAFRRWIDFHDRSAIRIGVSADLVHPTLQVSVLHRGPRETHFVDGGELLWRNRIKNMRKSSDRLVTQNGKG